jgi:hypothetical protein
MSAPRRREHQRRSPKRPHGEKVRPEQRAHAVRADVTDKPTIPAKFRRGVIMTPRDASGRGIDGDAGWAARRRQRQEVGACGVDGKRDPAPVVATILTPSAFMAPRADDP